MNFLKFKFRRYSSAAREVKTADAVAAAKRTAAMEKETAATAAVAAAVAAAEAASAATADVATVG